MDVPIVLVCFTEGKEDKASESEQKTGHDQEKTLVGWL